MRYSFKFNGISSDEMGVVVLVRPTLKSPQRRMQFYNVDGSIGSTSIDLGYEPIENTMEVVVETDNIDEFIGWWTGKGVLETSDRPNMYQNIIIYQAYDYQRTPRTNMYKITLAYKSYDPIWYKKDGWVKVTPTPDAKQVTFNIEGTVESQPKIKIDSTATEILLNDKKIDLRKKNTNPIILDLRSGEVFNEQGAKIDYGANIVGKVFLKPGENTLKANTPLGTISFLDPNAYL